MTEVQDPTSQPALKAGAIGFLDALVIGLASTSPAYSLAAVIGAIGPSPGSTPPARSWPRSCRCC